MKAKKNIIISFQQNQGVVRKKIFIFFIAQILIGFLALTPACKKDIKSADRLPVLTSNSPSDIAATRATLGGNITDVGMPA
jgi:hypothetical protein